MRIIEALTKFKSLSEIKVTKVEKKFTKAEIDNSGYESYVNSSTDDDINVCKKFLEITEDLIKKRGVSPSQIPNIFFKCGEEATKLFCSTNCSQKNIPKETNGAKKTYKSKNGSFKIKYFLLSLLKEQNDVIVWINEKFLGRRPYGDPQNPIIKTRCRTVQ